MGNISGFSMEVVNINEVREDVIKETNTLPEEIKKLKEQAEANALAVINCDTDSMSAKNDILISIEEFGLESLQKSSSRNKALGATLGQLSRSGSEGGQVLKSLTDLQREVKELDPSTVDFIKKGLLGKIYNPISNYFRRFEKTESVIASIVQSLEKGKNRLKNDNITLQIEQKALKELSVKLKKEIELAGYMDEFIESSALSLENTSENTERLRFIREEVLFPLRKHTMNMQKMIAINHQSIIAMEVIRRNNNELMIGVDEAVTVTVSALRTAVIVAQALYNQKITLQKIQALNETTNDLIVGTSRMLNEQSSEIYDEMTDGGVTVDALKEAFANLFETVEKVSEYKQKALPVLKQQIERFRELADRSEVEIKKLEVSDFVQGVK